MATVNAQQPGSERYGEGGYGLATRTLFTGGTFAGLIATILGAAGAWGLGDQVVLYALVALCVLGALTMFTAAAMTRRD